MNAITIDGLDEEDFRRSIESLLRHGDADRAAIKLCALLGSYAGEGGILPARFLTVSSADVMVAGWELFAERLSRYDRPNHPISAVCVAVIDPGAADAQPDAAGRLAPRIETGYFSDDAFPFSEANREDLLDGYTLYGCQWDGDCEETDATFSVEGIDDLYGAVAMLEAQLLSSDVPSLEEIRAGSLSSCYLAVLIHQAVRDHIRQHGLPRALCIMAGSNGVYPFFDAPVISSEECVEEGIVAPAKSEARSSQPADDFAEEGEAAGPSNGYQSLL